jgi:hypothetical protein
MLHSLNFHFLVKLSEVIPKIIKDMFNLLVDSFMINNVAAASK